MISKIRDNYIDNFFFPTLKNYIFVFITVFCQKFIEIYAIFLFYAIGPFPLGTTHLEGRFVCSDYMLFYTFENNYQICPLIKPVLKKIVHFSIIDLEIGKPCKLGYFLSLCWLRVSCLESVNLIAPLRQEGGLGSFLHVWLIWKYLLSRTAAF